MARPNVPPVPDDGTTNPQVVKFARVVRAILNSLVRKSHVSRTTGDNEWVIQVGDDASTLTAVEVFSKRPKLPGLPGPVHANAQAVVMQQVFTPRISYGQVG
jgi:hypothetical protein